MLLEAETSEVRAEVLDVLEQLERDPDNPPDSIRARRIRGAAARRTRADAFLGEFPHGFRITYSVVHGSPPVMMDEVIVKILAAAKLIEQPPIAQDRGPIYP